LALQRESTDSLSMTKGRLQERHKQGDHKPGKPGVFMDLYEQMENSGNSVH